MLRFLRNTLLVIAAPLFIIYAASVTGSRDWVRSSNSQANCRDPSSRAK